LNVLLSEQTGLPITITEDPLSTVVLGSGKALDDLVLLREVKIK
jgi:rod shape-determining protein MreB